MNKGTQRMWARRVLRAGWLLAPLLELPGKLWRSGFIALILFTAGVIAAMTMLIETLNKPWDPAPSVSIAEAGKNPCVRAMLLQHTDGVIKNITITDAIERCKNSNILEQQRKALQ